MTTYITQEQAAALARAQKIGAATSSNGVYFVAYCDDLQRLCNAAIQAYRDSLVAGVVLPELPKAKREVTRLADVPNLEWHVSSARYTSEALQDYARQAIADALAKQVPQGYKLVPVEPVEAQWGELARDIVFWLYMSGSPHHGSKLHDHLRNLGRDIPDWLTKEIPDVDHTPAKGTVAACIYKAMLAAAPDPKEIRCQDLNHRKK